MPIAHVRLYQFGHQVWIAIVWYALPPCAYVYNARAGFYKRIATLFSLSHKHDDDSTFHTMDLMRDLTAYCPTPPGQDFTVKMALREGAIAKFAMAAMSLFNSALRCCQGSNHLAEEVVGILDDALTLLVDALKHRKGSYAAACFTISCYVSVGCFPAGSFGQAPPVGACRDNVPPFSSFVFPDDEAEKGNPPPCNRRNFSFLECLREALEAYPRGLPLPHRVCNLYTGCLVAVVYLAFDGDNPTFRPVEVASTILTPVAAYIGRMMHDPGVVEMSLPSNHIHANPPVEPPQRHNPCPPSVLSLPIVIISHALRDVDIRSQCAVVTPASRSEASNRDLVKLPVCLMIPYPHRPPLAPSIPGSRGCTDDRCPRCDTNGRVGFAPSR